MQWSDEGIVLSARRHGERALLLRLLTKEHGRHAGLVRGGQGPKQRSVYEIGNQLIVQWRARLEEHLGSYSAELETSHASRFLDDPQRLAALASAAALADATLPEQEPHPRAYQGLADLIHRLEADHGWAAAYVLWEFDLLAELGFGLDLSHCAATGATEDLIYVSPRSGQAVSAVAGEPYRSRLLRLPPFLKGEGSPEIADLVDGLELTGFFLEQRVIAPHNGKMPAARGRFVETVKRMSRL